MSEPVRIVAVADTHLYVDKLAEVPDGDLFIHAGDLLQSGSLEELRASLDWLRDLPHEQKILVAGNHDGCLENDRQEAQAALADIGVRYVEDEEVSLCGLRIWGSPWQPSYGDSGFYLPPGQALVDVRGAIPEELDLLVTHSPPRGLGDRNAKGRREGCDELALRVRLVRPRLHLFGHIHHDGGLWVDHDTCFANVTTWNCGRAATVIDLPSSGRAKPVQVPPPGA